MGLRSVAWFQGVTDNVLASTTTWLHCSFSALALVPEFGSAATCPQSIGLHPAYDILMFERKVGVEGLLQWGKVNRVFEHDGVHDKVMCYLQEQLEINDGKSMMEQKRLMNSPLRSRRLLALHEAADAVSERFVEDAPAKRFAGKSRLLNGNKCLERNTIGQRTDWSYRKVREEVGDLDKHLSLQTKMVEEVIPILRNPGVFSMNSQRLHFVLSTERVHSRTSRICNNIPGERAPSEPKITRR